MTEFENKEKRNLYIYNGTWIFLTWMVTAIHHYYTGVLYDTMWRAAFAAYAAIPMILCVGLLLLYYRHGKRMLLWSYLGLSFIFFFLVVGLWEGAWCHTTKLILFYLDIPFHNAPASWNIPPAPVPTDIFSEVTGVLNFVFASVSLWYNIKLASFVSYGSKKKYQTGGHSVEEQTA